MEKKMYKFEVTDAFWDELKVTEGFGQFSDVTGELLDFIWKNKEGDTISDNRNNVICKKTHDWDIDNVVYLDENDSQLAYEILFERYEKQIAKYTCVLNELRMREHQMKYGISWRTRMKEQESKS